MNRRQIVLATAAAGSVAAGLGWHWWRDRAPREVADLWMRRFPRPEGGDLAMADFRGRPLVLNFWATWCPPCIKEMPELERFQRAYSPRGWRVVGLAVDRPEPVREFLARQPVSFSIGLAGLEGTDLSRQLGNERGLLPFTAVFDAQGRIVRRKLGETTLAELTTWADSL